MNKRLQDRVVVALASLAIESYSEALSLDDAKADPDTRESAWLAADAAALALARIPASNSPARNAKASALGEIFGAPTAKSIEDFCYVERELAASVIRDSIRVSA